MAIEPLAAFFSGKLISLDLSKATEQKLKIIGETNETIIKEAMLFSVAIFYRRQSPQSVLPYVYPHNLRLNHGQPGKKKKRERDTLLKNRSIRLDDIQDKILNNFTCGIGGCRKMLKIDHLGEVNMRVVCILVATFVYMIIRYEVRAAKELPSLAPFAAWLYPHMPSSPRGLDVLGAFSAFFYNRLPNSDSSNDHDLVQKVAGPHSVSHTHPRNYLLRNIRGTLFRLQFKENFCIVM